MDLFFLIFAFRIWERGIAIFREFLINREEEVLSSLLMFRCCFISALGAVKTTGLLRQTFRPRPRFLLGAIGVEAISLSFSFFIPQPRERGPQFSQHLAKSTKAS